jgi:uncharacterized protein (TIGR03437 family)
MNYMLRFVMGSMIFSAFLSACFAHSYGPPPGYTAAPGDNARACTQCHAGTLNSGKGSVQILLQSGAAYIPGVKQRITVQIADPVQVRWGFEMAARLNSDPQNSQAGEFIPVDNFTQVICADAGPKPCSSNITYIEHTSAGTRNGTTGGVTFEFDWNPPSSNVGPVTLYVAANAANGDGTFRGDLIYTTSLELDPAIPSTPSLAGGDAVSQATLAAGPVTPDSWVTIYGTNLGVTTRYWTDSDFLEGRMPFSLDGVSVSLNLLGSPRLAYIGYVSPTRVDFLIPSDALSTNAAFAQVRNPAGTSEALTFTIQPNAPQLYTADGKHVSGAQADGSALAKAAPGETVTLYGTGFGPTTPALIPGQFPTVANPVATLPQIMIGGEAANVMSASNAPGQPGVYQIQVQVPGDAATGDLPVVVLSGGFTSATTLITIQK